MRFQVVRGTPWHLEECQRVNRAAMLEGAELSVLDKRTRDPLLRIINRTTGFPSSFRQPIRSNSHWTAGLVYLKPPQIIVGFPCEGQPHCFFQLFGGMMTHHAPHCIRTRGFHLRGSQVILHRCKETVRKEYTESQNHDPPSACSPTPSWTRFQRASALVNSYTASLPRIIILPYGGNSTSAGGKIAPPPPPRKKRLRRA